MNSMLTRAAVAACVILASSAMGAAPGPFDKPVDKVVVRLPADPDNPQAKPKRTCSIYPDFMVKEIDLGEVGASELSIVPLAKGKKAPACEAKIAGEIVVKPDDWSGYFDGVKGPFAFFDAEDLHNDGMPFAVFSGSSGKKLFEDSRKGDALDAARLENGALILRYRRVFAAPCSLYADAKGCWKKIVAVTGLAESARPDCSAAYDREMKRTPKFAKDIPALPSIVGYPVELRYAGGKPSFTPQAGPVTCWLGE